MKQRLMSNCFRWLLKWIEWITGQRRVSFFVIFFGWTFDRFGFNDERQAEFLFWHVTFFINLLVFDCLRGWTFLWLVDFVVVIWLTNFCDNIRFGDGRNVQLLWGIFGSTFSRSLELRFVTQFTVHDTIGNVKSKIIEGKRRASSLKRQSCCSRTTHFLENLQVFDRLVECAILQLVVFYNNDFLWN